MVRESTPDDTANAIRDGTFALISPVMTLTDGLCVAITKWIPAALASCARRQIASSTSPGATIIKSARNTPHAPQDLGPYTQSVAFSHYNNIAAQLPVDPRTGKLVSGDIQAQARQCLTNIKAIVESIGHVMDDMVKVTLFLKNMLTEKLSK